MGLVTALRKLRRSKKSQQFNEDDRYDDSPATNDQWPGQHQTVPSPEPVDPPTQNTHPGLNETTVTHRRYPPLDTHYGTSLYGTFVAEHDDQFGETHDPFRSSLDPEQQHEQRPTSFTADHNRRLSHRLSQRSIQSSRRSNSNASRAAKRFSRHIWVSSNPDEDPSDNNNNNNNNDKNHDDRVSPMPDLTWSTVTTPDSERASWRYSGSSVGSRSQPPLRYTPRSAGRAFLSTTSRVSDEQRKSFRHSMGMRDGQPLVCTSDQQRKEWERLKEQLEAVS